MVPGYRAARLYVAAWFVFLGLIFIFVLGNLDWVPYVSVITMLPHIGALWVVVMLSLALGDRIRFLEQERNQLFQEARESLERHVREIEQMNRDKSTFLQYVSHELNTPINWIGAAEGWATTTRPPTPGPWCARGSSGWWAWSAPRCAILIWRTATGRPCWGAASRCCCWRRCWPAAPEPCAGAG